MQTLLKTCDSIVAPLSLFTGSMNNILHLKRSLKQKAQDPDIKEGTAEQCKAGSVRRRLPPQHVGTQSDNKE